MKRSVCASMLVSLAAAVLGGCSSTEQPARPVSSSAQGEDLRISDVYYAEHNHGWYRPGAPRQAMTETKTKERGAPSVLNRMLSLSRCIRLPSTALAKTAIPVRIVNSATNRIA